jgi:hypothetical protein
LLLLESDRRHDGGVVCLMPFGAILQCLPAMVKFENFVVGNSEEIGCLLDLFHYIIFKYITQIN